MTSSSWDRVWEQSGAAQVPLDAPTLENQIDRAKIEFLAPHVRRRGHAVEIGCGSARLLARLGLSGNHALTAVDASMEALARAAQTAAAAAVPMGTVCADASRLPFRTGSCEAVLSGGLLEHFRDPVPVLEEMVRILAPGGMFYADVVPRKFSLYRIGEAARMVRSEWLMPGVVETAHDAEFYCRHLNALGCRDTAFEYCGVYPPRLAGAVLSYTERLNGTRLARALGWYFMIRARKA
jgi:SAM-dependent methyltransferase